MTAASVFRHFFATMKIVAMAVAVLSGVAPLRGAEFNLKEIRYIQRVKSLTGLFTHGMDKKSQRGIRGHLMYDFYASLREPVELSGEERSRCASAEFQATVKEVTPGGDDRPMLAAQEYLVLLDEKQQPLYVMEYQLSHKVYFSRLVKSGDGIYQGQPDDDQEFVTAENPLAKSLKAAMAQPESDDSAEKNFEIFHRAVVEEGRRQNAELRGKFAAALTAAGENGALPVWMAAIEHGLLRGGTITLEDLKTITPPGTLRVQENEDGKLVARVSFRSARLAGELPPLVKDVPREDVADYGDRLEWAIVMTFLRPMNELEKWDMVRENWMGE